MTRIVFILISLSSFLFVFCPPLTFGEQPLKFGIIGPLSGENSSFGESIKNGALMAYEELSPEQRKNLSLIFEDDGFQPARTVGAFRKLVDMDKVTAVGVGGSSCGLAVSSLADQLKVPTVAVASDRNVVAGRSHIVNLWVTPETEAAAVYTEMLRRNYRVIARISSQHAFPEAVNKAFDQRIGKEIKIVLDQSYSDNVRDFRPFITRLRAVAGVDAVLLVLMPGQLGVFARQLREQGVTAPLFGYEFFEDPREVETARGALLNQWYVNSKSAHPDFLKAYEKRFPGGPTMAAANGYDMVKIMALAAQGKRSPDEVNKLLHTLRDFEGALGRYSATGQNTYTLPAAIKIVTADGFAELSEQPPQ